ncbi:hypothetical protein BH11BAC3_BH11BAC3_33130 [soil metagenome]
MRQIFLIFLTCLFFSCRKEIAKETNHNYYIEDFRKPGMSDYETVMAAYDSIPNYSDIYFAPQTYTFNHTPVIYKALNFYGPATLRRENQVTYTLKAFADNASTMLVLDDTNGIIAKDKFFLSFGQADSDNTPINQVQKIKGDTLFLDNSIGKTNGGIQNFPVGTKLFKNINFFWVVGTNKYPDKSCSFNELIFDGNRDNNQGSYSWLLNTAILAVTKNTTVYSHCKFINSPAETIVGHNADIRNCTFYDLNGSAFHTSADRVTSTESEIHSYLSDNVFENTNQIPNSIGGHSEGAITHSNSGGYYTATQNTFININGPVLGLLYPSVSIHDWGTSNINFTGNTINGAERMIWTIALLQGTIHDVIIEKNAISNMPDYDWSSGVDYYTPGITLTDKSGE